jgi:uncharacterized protein YxjI
LQPSPRTQQDAGLEPEKILGTLIAIAPVVGTARIVSAAGSILRAFALAEDLAEEDQYCWLCSFERERTQSSARFQPEGRTWQGYQGWLKVACECHTKGNTGMRNRREGRQERRGGGGDKSHFQMREKMVAIGDDFWIENEHGEKVYKVDGKALRVRQTLIFEDRSGRELAKIQERMLRVKDSMEVEGPGGDQIAMVKKALITPVRERWTVKIKGGPDLEVKGNILDHEYTIGEGREKVAEVSKKWFRVRDTYGVEIEPGQDDILILAVTVCIDQMAH